MKPASTSLSRTVRILLLLGWCSYAVRPLSAQQSAAATPHAVVDANYAAYAPSGSLSGVIRIANSEAMGTLLGYWIADFARCYPQVRFQRVAIAGNSPGPALTDGSVDIGPLARELPPDERAAFRARFNYEPLAIRVAGGSYKTPDKALAIAFLVNSRNPVSKLTFAQIDAVYARHRLPGVAEAQRWGDLGATGEWATHPIHIWGLIRPGEVRPGGAAPIPVSGNITRFLSERALGGSEFRDDISERTTVGAKKSAFEAIADGVASDPDALGYGGFNNVIPGVRSVAVAVSADGPYYTGTFEEVAAQLYPLSRVVYFYINRKPRTPLRPEIAEFVKFILSRDGQQDVVREGIFLPLPHAMAVQDLARLR